MKHDIQKMALAAVIPLFLLFILYILKFLEIGMDWNFTQLGVYPMEQRGMFGIFAHPLVHSSFKHLFANTIPLFFLMWCLFYFYRHIAPLHLFCHLDRMRYAYLSYRETGMAYRSQRHHIRTGILSVLQRHTAQARTAHRHFIAGNVSIWRPGMEHVPSVCQDDHFLGRAPQWSHSRHVVCHRLYGIRSPTA